jgi:hypothetical protein
MGIFDIFKPKQTTEPAGNPLAQYGIKQQQNPIASFGVPQGQPATTNQQIFTPTPTPLAPKVSQPQSNANQFDAALVEKYRQQFSSPDELQKQKMMLEADLQREQQRKMDSVKTRDNAITAPDTFDSTKMGANSSMTALQQKRRAAQARLTGLVEPTKNEIDIQNRLNALNENIAKASNLFTKQYSDAEKNPQGLFGGGLEAGLRDLDKEQTMKINALTNLQSALQGNLQSAQDLRANEYSQLKDLQTMTNPEVIGTPQVNQQTGDVYAYVQDPTTGTIEVQNVGNVGVDESFDIQSIVTDETTGETYAVGTVNGQLVTKPTGVRKQTSGSGGGTMAGFVGSPLVGQSNYSNLGTRQKTQADSINNLVASLKDYKDLYSTAVGLGGIEYFGGDAGLLETKLNSIIFAAAQAEGTGALQKADREVIEKIIPNPTTIGGGLNSFFKGGTSTGIKKIDDQIAKYTGQLANYGLQPSGINPYSSGNDTEQIPMISADGEPVYVPANEVEDALLEGYSYDL